MEIYVLIDNKPEGPYTRELVQQHLNSGQLKPTDLATYAGHSDWKPLSAVVHSWARIHPHASPIHPHASPIRRALPPKRKPIVAITVVALLLVVIGGAAFWMLRPKTPASVAAIVERDFPNDDFPKTLAELNAWYVEPPEGQNAATYFFKGASAIQVTDEDINSQDLPILGHGILPSSGPLTPLTMKSITSFVQRNEPAWEELQEGAKFEQARYPMDLKDLSPTVLPHLPKIRRAAQFGELRTVLYAESKQPKGAVDTLLLSLAVAQSLKDEPLGISQLDRVRCLAYEKDGLQYAMNSVAIFSNDLARLSTALAQVESQDAAGVPFTRVLVGQRTTFVAFADLPAEAMQKELNGIFEGSTNVPVAQKLRQNLKAQRAFMVETFENAFALRKELFPDRLKLDGYFASRASEATNQQFYLAQMFLEGAGKSLSREAAGLGNVRLMQTAVALEQFRQAHRGNYPGTLAELAPTYLPAIPVDPFDGEPLFYLKSHGYELHFAKAQISFVVEHPPK